MDRPKSGRPVWAIIAIMAVVRLALHLYTNIFAGYGIFRDELYYIACSNHPAWGYVDQPPLSVFLLALNRAVLGESLFALRLLPAIAGAATVWVTGLITRRLGGGPWAVFIACLALVLTPIHLAMCSFYSMNCFDWLLWALAFFLLVCIIQDNKPGHWVALGVVLGLGLLNKVGVLWLGFGLALGTLVSPLRKQLKTPWPWLAAGIALLLFVPFIIWNLTHDLAHLEFMHNAARLKYSGLTPADFFNGQILLVLPAGLILAMLGLGYFFLHQTGRKYLPLGVIFTATVAVLVINWHSKAEYLGPAYPALFAGGAVLLGNWLQKRYLAWLKYAVPALYVLMGAVTAPVAIPILPVQDFIRYSQRLGITPGNSEGHDPAELPQHFADMHGWENMAATVSRVYTALPDSVRSGTVVYARNYGQAGAIDYFRGQYKLPEVLSHHNNYWFWWDAEKDIDTIIIIGGSVQELENTLQQVEQAAVVRSEYAMPYETNLPVFFGRGLKRSLEEIRLADKSFH